MAIRHFSEAASRIVPVLGHYRERKTIMLQETKKISEISACDMTTAIFRNRVYILVAPGFEEAAVIYCLTKLREAALPVSLVGLVVGQIAGWHGLSICPDLTLDEVDAHKPMKLAVIPGGQQCATALLTDPRVHRLLHTLIAQEGRVGVMDTAIPVVTQFGLLPESIDGHYVMQNEEGMDGFVTELVSLMLNYSVVGKD